LLLPNAELLQKVFEASPILRANRVMKADGSLVSVEDTCWQQALLCQWVTTMFLGTLSVPGRPCLSDALQGNAVQAVALQPSQCNCKLSVDKSSSDNI
jgi:hypothetical protein